jgi:hypothetical protein
MIERFLLDRIDTESRAAAVGVEHHLAVAILANKAEAPIARFQDTLAGTEIAHNAVPLGSLMPPAA